MRRFVAVSMAFLAVSSLGHLSAQTANPSNDRDEIVRLNRELTDAFARRDPETVNRLLADDYTMVSPRGRLIVKDAYLQSRVGSGPVTESGHFDQVSVRLYGTTAIVTSQFVAQFLIAPSATPQQREAWRDAATVDGGPCKRRGGGNSRTDKWVKRDGRWQLVATQLSPIGFTGARDASASLALCGVNADELQWVDSPAFPGARIAVLSGSSYNGPYAVRIQRPDGHIEQPHRHEADEAVSVMSGVVHIGVGDRVERDTAKVFRAGAYVVIPARTVHYSWAEGAVVEEVYWNGPAAPISTSSRTEISLPRAALAGYVGTYRFDPARLTLTVTLEGAQLMAQLSGALSPFPIYPESETSFFLKAAPPGSSVGINAKIEFVKDPSADATGLIFHEATDRKATRVSK